MSIKTIAYHEAGHAVMCIEERVSVKSVSIVPYDDSGGRVTHGNVMGNIDPQFDNTKRGRWRMESFVRIALAGPAAQKLFSPTSIRKHHVEDDNRQAIDLLLRYVHSPRQCDAYFKLLEVQTEEKLAMTYVWLQVEAVAKALLECRELSGKEVREIGYEAWKPELPPGLNIMVQ